MQLLLLKLGIPSSFLVCVVSPHPGAPLPSPMSLVPSPWLVYSILPQFLYISRNFSSPYLTHYTMHYYWRLELPSAPGVRLSVLFRLPSSSSVLIIFPHLIFPTSFYPLYHALLLETGTPLCPWCTFIRSSPSSGCKLASHTISLMSNEKSHILHHSEHASFVPLLSNSA